MPPEEKKELLRARDKEGWTPIHYAARYYRNTILEFALKLDGDGNQAAELGYSQCQCLISRYWAPQCKDP